MRVFAVSNYSDAITQENRMSSCYIERRLRKGKTMKTLNFTLALLFLAISCFFPLSIANSSGIDHSLYIDRVNRKLYVISPNGDVVLTANCGIGKGGLKKKNNMSDHITPTGEFTIDLILYNNANYNAISKSNIEKYRNNKTYSTLTQGTTGLAQLFENMNQIDFNEDGKPDRAYGAAYIGLDSKTVVTGPKVRLYKDLPYWYSIGIHGTPDRKNIGKARSGGCIHISDNILTKLITEGIVKIGTKVIINDEMPEISTH